jgi:uncharacterized membrane protein YoaK (UPF0700 family)
VAAVGQVASIYVGPHQLLVTAEIQPLDAISGLRLRQLLAELRGRVTEAIPRAALVCLIGLPVDGGGTRRNVVIALLAAALGLQNATVRRLAVPDLTTTVLTLTLTGLAADFGVAGRSPRVGRRLAAVGLMAAGALVGALLLRVDVALPVLAAAVVIALATVVLRFGRPPRDNVT